MWKVPGIVVKAVRENPWLKWIGLPGLCAVATFITAWNRDVFSKGKDSIGRAEVELKLSKAELDAKETTATLRAEIAAKASKESVDSINRQLTEMKAEQAEQGRDIKSILKNMPRRGDGQ